MNAHTNESQNDVRRAIREGMEEYRFLQRLAREQGLPKLTAKKAELREQLEELGVDTSWPPAPIAAPADPNSRPSLLEEVYGGDVPEQSEVEPEELAELRLAGVVAYAEGLLEEADVFADRARGLGSEATNLAAVAERYTKAAVELSGFGYLADTAAGANASRQARQWADEARAVESMARESRELAERLLKAHGLLLIVAEELVELGVQLPEELVALITPPAPSYWEFKLTGEVSWRAVVEGRTLEEAILAVQVGEIVEGGPSPLAMHQRPRHDAARWCQGGYEAFLQALQKVEPGAPVKNHLYGCTLWVRQLDSFQSAPAWAPTFLTFEFILDGDEYEGRARVRGADLNHARERLLAGEIESGDRLTDSEMEPEELGELRLALGELSELQQSVSRFGHTLRYAVVA